MSDNPKPTHLVRVSKHQARALEKAEFISYLAQADLSDARRYFELARYSTRQHDKGELMAGAVVGTVLGWILGGGTWVGSLVTGVLAFFSTLIVIFMIHWTRSPSAFHRAAIAERNAAQFALEELRRSEPRLTGRIICVEINPNLTTKTGDHIYDCFVIMLVRVSGDTATPTMASRWEIGLIWEEIDYPGTREKLDGYRVKRDYAHPTKQGTEFETVWKPLDEFPNNEDITNTNYKAGWLHFSIRSLPLNAVENGKLKQDVIVRLTALDSKENPHVIYEGTTWGLGSCGVIRRAQKGMRINPTGEWPTVEFHDTWKE